MTEHVLDDTALLRLAYPYALDAVSAREESAIGARLAVADPATRSAFRDLTRDVRETMALLSSASSATPPPRLRTRVLDAAVRTPQDPPSAGAARSPRFRWLFLAAAAAVITIVALGAPPVPHYGPGPHPDTKTQLRDTW